MNLFQPAVTTKQTNKQTKKPSFTTLINVKHFCLTSAYFYFPKLTQTFVPLQNRQHFSFPFTKSQKPSARSLPDTVKRTNTVLKTAGRRVFKENWTHVQCIYIDCNISTVDWWTLFIQKCLHVWDKKWFLISYLLNVCLCGKIHRNKTWKNIKEYWNFCIFGP